MAKAVVVLGSGKRMFGERAGSTALTLVDSKPAGDCLILIYAPTTTEEA
jgi:hypothetical protein